MKSLSKYQDKRRLISRSISSTQVAKTLDWISHLSITRDSRFRHDLFSLTFLLVCMSTAFAIFLFLIFVGIETGRYFPVVQAVGDLRLSSDYRNSEAPFTSATLIGDQVILSTDGNGIQVYDTRSGINGFWEHFDAQNTSGKLSDDHVKDLTSFNDNALLIVNEQLLKSDINFQDWDALIGQDGFHDLNIESDITSALLTDDRRVLFVATRDYGLGQYDIQEHQWEKISLDTEVSIYSNAVNSLALEGGYLWVGTTKGLNVFELAKTSPQLVGARRSDLELPNYDIREIQISDGNAWVRSAAGGLLHLQDFTSNASRGWETTIGEVGFAALTSGNTHLTAVLLANEKLWVATNDSGIGAYDLQRHDWKSYTRQNGLSSDNITGLMFYHDTIWAVTTNSVDTFDTSGDRWTSSLRLQETIAHIRDSAGELWYVTEEGNVGVYNEQNSTWQSIIGSGILAGADASTEIKALAVFDQHLWLVVEDLGIGEYAPDTHSWQMHNDGLSLDEEPIGRVVELKVMSGSLWCRVERISENGSYFQVYKWEDGNWQAKNTEDTSIVAMEDDGTTPWLLQSDSSVLNGNTGEKNFTARSTDTMDFTGMAQHGDRLYLSTRENGIFYYDQTTHSWHAVERLQNTGILDLHSDDAGLWYVTNTGEVGFYDFLSGSTNNLVSRSQLTSNVGEITTFVWYRNKMWIGTSGARIFEYDPLTHEIRSADLQTENQLSNVSAIVELTISGDSLWCRTSGTGQNLFRYDDSKKVWVVVDSNIGAIEYDQNYLWSLSFDGEVSLASMDNAPGYFSQGFNGLQTAHYAAVDRLGQLWFISRSDGAGVYLPEFHRWLDVPSSSSRMAANDLLILPTSESKTDLALLATDGGIHDFKSSLGKIESAGTELAGVKVDELHLGNDKVWGLSHDNGGAQILWRSVSDESHKWTPVLGGDISNENPSSVVEVVYGGDKFWVRDTGGSLYSYDPMTHQWQQECSSISHVDDIWVADNLLWVSSNGLMGGEIYRIGDSIYDYCNKYLSESRGIEFTAPTKGILWYAAKQYLEVINGSGHHTSIVDSGSSKSFQYNYFSWIRYVPLFYIGLVLAIILVAIGISKIPAWEWKWEWRVFRIYVTNDWLWGAWFILSLIVVVYCYFAWQNSRTTTEKAWESRIEVQGLVNYGGDVWVASNHGIWRFSYDFDKSVLKLNSYFAEFNGWLPSDNITDLRVINKKIYAQVNNWRWLKLKNLGPLEFGWDEIDALPEEVIQIEKKGWKWVLQDNQFSVGVKDDFGEYRDVDYQNGAFSFELPHSIVVQQDNLLSVTVNSLALYKLNRNGLLDLKRLYYSGEDGLPKDEIQRCLWKQPSFYCDLNGAVYVLVDNYWEPVMGKSPFGDLDEIYNNPLTNVVIKKSVDSIEIVPQTLLEDSGGFAYDHIEKIALSGEMLWLITPVGAWQARLGQDGVLVLETFVSDKTGIESLFSGIDTSTWRPDGEPWVWEKSHDRATGQEKVQITLGDHTGIERIFESSGVFSDQLTASIFSEAVEKGHGNYLWLGTHQGIWRVLYQSSTDIKYERYYPVNGEEIKHFLLQNSSLYAQSASGKVLIYNPEQDTWDTTTRDPFTTPVSIQDDKLGTLSKNQRGVVSLHQQDSVQPKFLFDEVWDLAAHSGFLWTATPVGVYEYRTDGGTLDLIRRYTVLDGLPDENVWDLKWSELGELYCRVSAYGSNEFAVLRNSFWTVVPFEETPFTNEQMPVKDTPGFAKWYANEDSVSVYLGDTPVRFISGKFDFDFVYDVLITENNLWVLTAYGPLIYKADDFSFQRFIAPPVPFVDINIKNDRLFARTEYGSLFIWQNSQWTAWTSKTEEDYPFVRKTVSIDDGYQWLTIEKPDTTTLPLIQAWDIPAKKIFSYSGKFSFDFIQDILTDQTQVWLATQGGVFYKQDIQSSLTRLETRGLPDRDDHPLLSLRNELLIEFGEDVWALDPVAGWQKNPGAAASFTRGQVVFQDGEWYTQDSQLRWNPNWIEIKGLEGYQVFNSNGRFVFDAVHSVASDGENIWLGTSGGLVRATLSDNVHLRYRELVTQNDGLVSNDVNRVWLDKTGDLWLTLVNSASKKKIYQNLNQMSMPVLTDPFLLTGINSQFYSDPRDFTLKVDERGAQIWLDGALRKEYPNTQKFLGVWGASVAINNIVSYLDDERYVWLVTDRAFVRVDKQVLEKLLRKY